MFSAGQSGRAVTVAQALGRGRNNFDLVRLVAALLVIYGHSFGIQPEMGKQDFLLSWTGFACAAMAVKVFFFLSGLLVTNSLYERRSVGEYLISRAFRILPGLAFVLAASALVIGPLATNLALVDYFSNSNTYLYVKRQLLMQSWGTQGLGFYDLPGVFIENPYKNNVNASLWSIVVEVYAYLFLAAIYLIGITDKRGATALGVVVILDSLLPSRIIFTFLPQGNEDFSYLPFCFACGMLLALHKDYLKIPSISGMLGFLLLCYLLRDSDFKRFAFYSAIFAGILYFSTNLSVLKIAPPIDISYGVFLWGFPIQQMIVHLLPELGRTGNFLLAMIFAVLMACFSWFFVEKKAINLGKRINLQLRNRKLRNDQHESVR